jgi:peptide deformylase
MARPTEISVQHHATPEEIRDRAANHQFQKDVKELSDLCASVPHEMDALKQGVLSKDSIDKLKRMEKLSKHIREQLTRE